MADADTGAERAIDGKQVGLGLFALLLLGGTAIRVCSAPQKPSEIKVVVALGTSSVPMEQAALPHYPKDQAGLSAPIAAAWSGGGEVVVAGIDVPSKAIRVQRIGRANDDILADRMALDDVRWSPDADLKLAAAPEGVAVTWRGLRDGKLVRQLVILNPDLTVKTPATDVAAAHCVTKEGLWFADDAVATSKPWTGTPISVPLPKEKDAALLCATNRAFAVIEEDDKTSVLPLVADAGAPTVMTRTSDFGEDDERDVSEYNVGDDVGVVRLAQSGALAIREMTSGVPGQLHKLRIALGEDDDLVAVDAANHEVVVVYTQDASAKCKSETVVATRVVALRVDRRTFDESVVELSPGECGNEIGPFFTGPIGDDLSVAWLERTSGIGKVRAPIVGLAHTTVALGVQPQLARIDQAADAIADAGCDGAHCWAAALVRRADNDAMTPGYVRILRW